MASPVSTPQEASWWWKPIGPTGDFFSSFLTSSIFLFPGSWWDCWDSGSFIPFRGLLAIFCSEGLLEGVSDRSAALSEVPLSCCAGIRNSDSGGRTHGFSSFWFPLEVRALKSYFFSFWELVRFQLSPIQSSRDPSLRALLLFWGLK